MQWATAFLEQFRNSLVTRDHKAIIAMNMPDDITGWGIEDQDDFNCLSWLERRCQQRFSQIEEADIEFEPIDVFSTKQVKMLICNARRNHTLKNGTRCCDDDLRFSCYLVVHDNTLKIRHIHLSKPWPEDVDVPSASLPDRDHYGEPEIPSRLDETALKPFIEHLKKRSEYGSQHDLDGLVSLQHPEGNPVFWPIHGDAIEGIEDYRHYVQHLVAAYPHAYIKYSNPVVFRSDDMACLSAYAVAGYERGGEPQQVSPVRASFFLQLHKGQWLCRHSHWSLPFASTRADTCFSSRTPIHQTVGQA